MRFLLISLDMQAHLFGTWWLIYVMCDFSERQRLCIEKSNEQWDYLIFDCGLPKSPCSFVSKAARAAVSLANALYDYKNMLWD